MKRILALIATNILGKITAVISGILIARLLGSSLKGIYSLMLLLPSMFVSFFDFGIGQATAYYYKKANTVEDKNAVMTNMLAFYALLSISVPVLLLFLRPTITKIFPLLTEDWMYVLSIVAYPFFLLQNYITTTSIAIGKVKRYSIATICKEVTFLIAIYILYATKVVSIYLIFLVYISVNFLLTFALILLILMPTIKFNFRYLSLSKTTKLLKYGYKLNILSIVSWAYYKVSIIIAGNLLSAADVGIFSVSTALAEMPFIIANAAAIITFVDNVDAKSDDKRNYYNIKTPMLLITISAIFLALLGKIGIQVLYSAEYVGAYYPLLILLPGNVIFGYYKLYGNKLAAAGKPEMLIFISLISMVVVIGMDFVLIPMFGLFGTAMACTVAYCVSGFMAISISCKIFRKKIVDLLFFDRFEINELISQTKLMIKKVFH